MYFDLAPALEDINVTYPIDGLEELAADGRVANPAVSFMGYFSNVFRTRDEVAPAVVDAVRKSRADAALLIPVLTALSPIRRIGRSRSGAGRYIHRRDCNQPRTDQPGHASARPVHATRTWPESWHARRFRSTAGDPSGGAGAVGYRARAVHARRLAARSRGCLIHLAGGL